jgi:hypothetical protein
MPIRTPPQHNTTNPPGQVAYNFEKPLQGLVEDYTAETAQNALQAAFDRGLRQGYLEGWEAARRRFLKPDILGPVDPNSEESR